MDKSEGEFDPQARNAILKELRVQSWKFFDRLDESISKYTQHIFIVNAGGSAATLAFLGTKTGSTFAIWPLLFFAAGVIACGISLLASIFIEKAAFNDALNRRTKFNETNKTECLFPEKGEMENWTSSRIARRAVLIAHILFIAGVIIGGIAYWCSPTPELAGTGTH